MTSSLTYVFVNQKMVISKTMKFYEQQLALLHKKKKNQTKTRDKIIHRLLLTLDAWFTFESNLLSEQSISEKKEKTALWVSLFPLQCHKLNCYSINHQSAGNSRQSSLNEKKGERAL